jgi:hypothetical protein
MENHFATDSSSHENSDNPVNYYLTPSSYIRDNRGWLDMKTTHLTPHSV